ncbi:mannan endo-1,4-beta-mannosidase [Rhizoctonia solani 123E]|uniref:mannan endo-1,4-beta-mannosidase n=2 Tax=Rhizoctonia solani AG-3 TaxID=1086053 RepID=A0A074RDS1_9AGAM|nr:mannan endo-1,4-beta-mannosidase [Rhizoctonia solani 123E]
MDVYTVNLGGQYHDSFFVEPKIKAAFKNYVQGVVSRYRKSPAIFSWQVNRFKYCVQLANEPRCVADSKRNLPRGPSCNHTVTNQWMDEISRFIRKIDGFHMISTGEEGFFNFPGDPDWTCNGDRGTDFYANTELPAISYGTYHVYPDWWGKTPEWVLNFTAQHGIAQKKIGKPVVWEEYGWMSPEARLQYLGTVSNYTRLQAIRPWQKAVLDNKLTGDQFWQLGISNLSFGRSTDDGFTIYLDDPEAKTLIYDHVKKVNAQNHKR